MDDHDDLPRPNEAGRKGSTVEDEIGRAGEEHSVFHAGRFAFGSICDDEWPATVSQQGAEFADGWERCATATDQSGALDFAKSRCSPRVGRWMMHQGAVTLEVRCQPRRRPGLGW
jgi:hypothetical protein